MAIITTAGENLIAAQQAAGQNLVIDQIIFANIGGLDHTATPSKSEGKPSAGQIVATETITQTGVVNANTVVYSMTMPSTMGTWSFNWMGLYSSAHNIVVAVAYTPLQEKRATVGEVLGNVLNKNFAIEFVGAASTTGITIDAQSWQLDYTARLETMDEIQRQAIKNIYGQGVFLNNGFKVEYTGTNYILKAGQACVGGLFIKLDSDQVITPGALPQTVWLDVYQQKTMAGVQNVFDVTINGGATLSDYTANGVAHSLFNVGRIFSQTNISDYREIIKTFEVYHSGNSVNPLDYGVGTTLPKNSNWNEIVESGWYSNLSSTQEEIPAGVGFLAMNHFEVDGSYAVQVCYRSHAAEPRTWRRSRNNDGWGLWVEIFDSENSVNPLDFGLGTNAIETDDFDSIQLNGFYRNKTIDCVGRPPVGSSLYALTHINRSNNEAIQTAIRALSSEPFYWMRVKSSGVWSDWKRVVTDISDSINSDDSDTAASSKAVKIAYDLAAGMAAASHTHAAGDLPAASTGEKGISKLSSSTNSDSETEAATPKAVKAAMAVASAAQSTANGKANSSHTHSIANVSGLQEALAAAGDDLSSLTLVWSGNSHIVDLDNIAGGYPGDGLYLVKADNWQCLVYANKGNTTSAIYRSSGVGAARIYGHIYISNGSEVVSSKVRETSITNENIDYIYKVG